MQGDSSPLSRRCLRMNNGISSPLLLGRSPFFFLCVLSAARIDSVLCAR